MWGDSGYEGTKLFEKLAEDGYEMEVIKRPHKKFQIMRRRWVVERTFGWMDLNRRLSKDYERKPQTSETLMEIAMIRLMVRRLGKMQDF